MQLKTHNTIYYWSWRCSSKKLRKILLFRMTKCSKVFKRQWFQCPHISPFLNIIACKTCEAQELVDQVAFTLRALPDKSSIIKVGLHAGSVHVSRDAMSWFKCPEEDNKSAVAFLCESCRQVVTVAVGYAARLIERVVSQYKIFTSLWEPFSGYF